MHEGSVSYSLGLKGIPACSEEVGLDRDLRLAQFTGARVHIQHVSTAVAMRAIQRAKADGVRVTAEVTPHHLMFHHGHIGDYDTRFKMNPPLRTPEDNAALLEGVKDGTFDVIATDHAPHTEFEKNNDFASAPFGVTGLETALVALHDRFITRGVFGWDVLVRRFSAEPRRLLKLPPVPIREGGSADFVVFNPERQTHVSREHMRSKSTNTPLLGETLRGAIERVVYRGVEL
jgi:dihydroorotase